VSRSPAFWQVASPAKCVQEGLSEAGSVRSVINLQSLNGRQLPPPSRPRLLLPDPTRRPCGGRPEVNSSSETRGSGARRVTAYCLILNEGPLTASGPPQPPDRNLTNLAVRSLVNERRLSGSARSAANGRDEGALPSGCLLQARLTAPGPIADRQVSGGDSKNADLRSANSLRRKDPLPVVQRCWSAPRNRTSVKVLLFGFKWAGSGLAAFGGLTAEADARSCGCRSREDPNADVCYPLVLPDKQTYVHVISTG
jgi:hypothetical protein